MAKNYIVLYGRNSILERLKANPRTIRKVFIRDKLALPDIETLTRRNRIPLERISGEDLARMRPAKDIQGAVARVEHFSYVPFDDLLSLDGSKRPSFIFLDRINDPQNLGVIIRTAACFGKFAIVIPKFEACEVTEAVLHVASGGENYVPISMVTNLTGAIISAKSCGYWIMGGIVSEQAQPLSQISLPFPLGIVLGFEGKGIRPGLQKQLDIQAHIPMEGAGLSFNVAMACVVFCYEVARQRKDRA
ncbi:TrmH family RNA methyltransferase [Candidatus Omnitrophota bacterium]